MPKPKSTQRALYEYHHPTITIRLSIAERDALQKKAMAAGLTIPAWVRSLASEDQADPEDAAAVFQRGVNFGMRLTDLSAQMTGAWLLWRSPLMQRPDPLSIAWHTPVPVVAGPAPRVWDVMSQVASWTDPDLDWVVAIAEGQPTVPDRVRRGGIHWPTASQVLAPNELTWRRFWREYRDLAQEYVQLWAPVVLEASLNSDADDLS